MFKVFGKNVDINEKISDAYLSMYPQKDTLTDADMHVLALSGGCDENSSEIELKNSIERGMYETVKMMPQFAKDFAEWQKLGYKFND